MDLKTLVGSGDKIALFTLPVLVGGLVLNAMFPSWFAVGGPPAALRVISIIILIPGLAIWLWSVVLLLTRASRGELLTRGPYSLVKHPLYVSVSLLVLPWVGFLLNSWLGVVVGLTLYVASRIFAPAEEASLSKRFGAQWGKYCRTVKLGWL